MDATNALDALETAVFEDPARGLELASHLVVDAPYRARYYGVVANGYRRLGRYSESETTIQKAFELVTDPFERAELHRRSAMLRCSLREWGQAISEANVAAGIHEDARPSGIPGPPDRGLPAALIARGQIHYNAHLNAIPIGDLFLASADYRRALELAPNPQEAPIVHVSAVHNLALMALDTGVGITNAQTALWHARCRLAELGLLSSPAGARMRWVRAMVDWHAGSQSNEYGGRFRLRIMTALETSRKLLLKRGAVYDAILVSLDLGLFYLDHPKGPRWNDLQRLSVEIYRLNWSATQDLLASLLLWRQAIMTEVMPAETLEYVYSRVRGLAKPDPRRHAHGEWLDRELGRPPATESVLYRVGASELTL